MAGDAAATGPGLLSGVVLAFARALGEFGATLTFAGSRQGVTRTLPLEIYLQREGDPDAAVALSVLLVAIAAVVVIGLGARRIPGGAGAVAELTCPPPSPTADWMWQFTIAAGEVLAVLGPTGPESRRRGGDHRVAARPTPQWCGWATAH